jgi:hypothetical protein
MGIVTTSELPESEEIVSVFFDLVNISFHIKMTISSFAY